MFNQNKECNPQLLAVGKNRFIHYVKNHDLNGTIFTVYYWASAYVDKILLVAYTVQENMKEMQTSVDERAVVEEMVAKIEFLHETAKHG